MPKILSYYEGVLIMMNWLIVILIMLTVGFVILLFAIRNRRSKRNKKIFKIVILLLIILLISCFTLLVIKNRINEDKYGWVTNYMDYHSLHEFSLGENQRIALIDSGISDFQYKQSISTIHKSLIGSDADDIGHGTMMFSIIKGWGNGIMGIAPNSDILSIKVTDHDGTMNPSLVIDAIQLAIDNKCSIINLSLGTYVFNEDINIIITEAINQNITVVAASGDYMHDELLFPANVSGVISVGALTKDDKAWQYSNGKTICTILAPGDDIKVINMEEEIINTSGTSQSTAIISGYIALLKDYWDRNNVKYSNADIITLLEDINLQKINYKTPFISTPK